MGLFLHRAVLCSDRSERFWLFVQNGLAQFHRVLEREERRRGKVVRAVSIFKVALEGGTRAWVAAGLSLETGATRMATPPDDMRLRAREQEGGVEAAMRAYLAWEINLAAQMAADTDHRFRILHG